MKVILISLKGFMLNYFPMKPMERVDSFIPLLIDKKFDFKKASNRQDQFLIKGFTF